MARFPTKTNSPAFVAAAPCALRTSSFAPAACTARAPLRAARAPSAATLRMLVGILFSTTTGNTQEVADLVKEKLGSAADEPKECDEVSADELAAYEHLVVGAPTWNTGEDEMRSGTSWDDYLYDTVANTDLSGKKVAVFGCGDAVGYEDNFCDAIEEMHDVFQKAGASPVGYTAEDIYEYEATKSVRDGKFLGLPVDNVNEAATVEENVSAWVEQISGEMGL